MSIASSPSVLFDCDGVILQSNSLKSNAFGDVLEGYDPVLVRDFVDWHKATGGVSRFFKFARFFRDTLKVTDWEARTEKACSDFGDIVSQGLRSCDTVPGFEVLVAQLRARAIPLAVNTGGAQDEIRIVFAERGFAPDFVEIFGSPTTKHDNMAKLKDQGLIKPGTSYLGDSELDFELAQNFQMNFIYVAYESEWAEGARMTEQAGGTVVPDLNALNTAFA